MTLLSWTEQYRIGDACIDDEHRELFRLINEFHDRWQSGHDRREIAAVLNRLVRYAQEHFQHEEQIMAAVGYPRLDEHRTAHESLFESIFRLHEEYARGDSHLEQDTVKFVKGWLVEHIIRNDYLFRDYLLRHRPPG